MATTRRYTHSAGLAGLADIATTAGLVGADIIMVAIMDGTEAVGTGGIIAGRISRITDTPAESEMAPSGAIC